MSDPGTSYRSREEVQEVRQKRDPISSFRERMVQTGLATVEELKKIDADVKKEVDAAADIAKVEPEIAVSELSCDIYSNTIQPEVRGVRPDQMLKHTTLGHAVNMK